MKNKKSITFPTKTNSIIAIMFFFTVIIITLPEALFAQTNSSTPNKSKVLANLTSKVTFIELGSVKCIPCREMQPVMRSIEKKYGSQVKVIFYDVWTESGKESAKQFVFDVIPTQIFLDKSGKEYFRHEGFFPEKELVKILAQKGVR